MPNSEPSNYSLLKVLPNLNSVVLYKAKFDSSSFAIFAQGSFFKKKLRITVINRSCS